MRAGGDRERKRETDKINVTIYNYIVIMCFHVLHAHTYYTDKANQGIYTQRLHTHFLMKRYPALEVTLVSGTWYSLNGSGEQKRNES